jgi:hypothetical protein
MSVLQSFLYGKLSLLILTIGYVFLFGGLYLFGYSQGRARCDKNKPEPVDPTQYGLGMAGLIIGCILIAFYHINQMRNY